MNNVSCYPYSLSVQTQGGDHTFNTLLPLVVTAKSVKVYGPQEMFLPASTQASNSYC